MCDFCGDVGRILAVDEMNKFEFQRKFIARTIFKNECDESLIINCTMIALLFGIVMWLTNDHLYLTAAAYMSKILKQKQYFFCISFGLSYNKGWSSMSSS